MPSFTLSDSLFLTGQVTSLEVGKEGNPLTQIPYWRLYAVFRLSHWGLRLIDGVEVSLVPPYSIHREIFLD